MKLEANSEPSKWAQRFLAWYCPSHLFESIEGDLLEAFDDDLQSHGRRKANRRYIWGVVRFFRPGILARNSYSHTANNTTMIGNYLKVAIRNIQKRKLYSFINAFGLSIGIAFCLLIYLYIQDERSFDQFHENKDQIVRVQEYSYNTWQPNPDPPYNESAYIQSTLQSVLKDEVSEVKYATRLNSNGQAIMKVADKIFTETISYIDADFFKMFTFPLMEGNAEKLFQSKNEVVLTPSIAEKYFGEESPLGQSIVLDIQGEQEFLVAGIISPAPSNSSIDFEILVPQENRPYYDRNMQNWGSFNTNLLVQLHEGTAHSQFEESLSRVVEKYMGSTLEHRRNRPGVDPDIMLFQYKFVPMVDIHLTSDISWTRVSDPTYSYILGGVALLILIIACINYISLALTSSLARSMEVGIRKVSGARKNQILYQFSFESIITAMVSAVFGMLIVMLFLPYFNAFTLKDLHLQNLVQWDFILLIIALSIIVGLAAGAYPALFLSRFKPASILKSRSSKFKSGFTKPLVVIQFFLSATLIICSFIMYRQMNYIATVDLGYQKEQIVVVPTQMGWNQASNDAVAAYRAQLATQPDVISVSGTSSSFSNGWSRHGYLIDGEQKAAFVYSVDPEYITTLEIELLEGRNFDASRASDSMAIIVNEALVKDMGWDKPLEEYLNWTQDSIGLGSKVIGVVKDYHFRSLEEEIGTLFLSMDKKRAGYLTSMLVKINTEDIPSTIDLLRTNWKELYPDKPFDFSFLDENIAQQYASYERWMNIMALATGLAILIACLGLFGLSGINALNKTKEIGIRKIMGAKLGQIFYLLNRAYFFYAVVAFLLAVPIAWYGMDKWLSGFQFRTAIGWEIFAVSILVGLVTAFITVSYHGIKAALVNPAETLKNE